MTFSDPFSTSNTLNVNAPEFVPGRGFIFQESQNEILTQTDPLAKDLDVDDSSPWINVTPTTDVDVVQESKNSSEIDRNTLDQPDASCSHKTTEEQVKEPATKPQVDSDFCHDGSDWDAEHDLEKPAPAISDNFQETQTHHVPNSKADETGKRSGVVLKDPDPRPHLNLVFIGHVDAGKSTTCGNILVLTGEVDSRTLEKYEREAKEKNRDTWYYAFIVDVNEEERQKGKTVEVGRATFQLEKTRFTILDAPGHKNFVPNMISGAAQADVAVLIISARKGEFETGFERGGQTREHALLAKTLGVSQLIVAINKMDDPTCNWSEERYEEIKKKLMPYLRSCGYNPAKDINVIPISGLSGENIKTHVTDPSCASCKVASWYPKSSPTLFQILDNIKPPERNKDGPLRIPLLEGFRDQGVSVVGKIESGTVYSGQNAIVMPNKTKIKIVGVSIGEEDVSYAYPGDNVLLRVSGVEEEQLTKGLVLCSVDDLCPCVVSFKAYIMIVELLKHRPLLTAGYTCVLHCHTLMEECQITYLFESIDKVNKKKKLKPLYVKGNSILICQIKLQSSICIETFTELPQLGRFTLRDEGKTIAIGKVLEILE